MGLPFGKKQNGEIIPHLQPLYINNEISILEILQNAQAFSDIILDIIKVDIIFILAVCIGCLKYVYRVKEIF